jgi:hypothetical protein
MTVKAQVLPLRRLPQVRYEDAAGLRQRIIPLRLLGYLDGDAALSWWHRNVARSQYAVQGWRKAKIYPDFIFAVGRKDGSSRITVLETKGDQLDNLDTAYMVSFLAA